MKEYIFTVTVKIDETNKNHPKFEDMKLGILEAVSTPDNKLFGIDDVEVLGFEV